MVVIPKEICVLHFHQQDLYATSAKQFVYHLGKSAHHWHEVNFVLYCYHANSGTKQTLYSTVIQ